MHVWVYWVYILGVMVAKTLHSRVHAHVLYGGWGKRVLCRPVMMDIGIFPNVDYIHQKYLLLGVFQGGSMMLVHGPPTLVSYLAYGHCAHCAHCYLCQISLCLKF